jgi:hypothetical protein
MKTWEEIYSTEFAPLLDINVSYEKRGLIPGLYHRSKGFKIIFDELLKVKQKDFLIIETGSTRKPDNWKDGNSGFLFAEFVKLHGGFVKSVDINQKAVDSANNHIDARYHKSFCSDSVSWLASQSDLDMIDLFYLDSMNVKWQNDASSADHHLKEFRVIESYLSSGSIVAIDDNSFLLNGKRTGKGRKIFDYLKSKNILPVYDEYQIIYRF